ncbi:MAG: hypothetical protein AB8C84_09820 [Oligoflexales bacterium]
MTPSDDLAVLVLAAGSAKKKIPALPLSQDCLAFLPINSQPLARLVINFYKDHGVQHVYIACEERDVDALTEELKIYGDSVHILSIESTSNVVDTLSLACLQIQHEDLIVHAVTTIPTVFLNDSESVLLEDCLAYPEDWSGVLPQKFPHTQFVSKSEERPDVKAHAFTGVFRCHKSLILEVAPRLKGNQRKDLLNLICKAYENTDFLWKKDEWLDCGHVQKFYQTRKKIFGSRYFNSISIEEKTDVLKKTSTNIKKLYAEKSYIEKLPDELKIFFPRVVSYDESKDLAELKMEYYGYPTLAEMMLYWDLPLSLWDSLFQKLSDALSIFREYNFSYSEEATQNIYVNKTLERVKDFREQNVFSTLNIFNQETIVINNVEMPGWGKVSHHIEKVYKSSFSKENFTAIHGDFCFNNILGDPFTAIIKLIDPRGSFGGSECQISGDHKYDWAKWGHSVVGCYDYIVNDLFHIEQNKEDEWILDIPERPWQKDLKHLFWKQVDESKLEREKISWIISTLFLSMTPLHKDNPLRQQAMFLTGLQLYPYKNI